MQMMDTMTERILNIEIENEKIKQNDIPFFLKYNTRITE